MQSMFSCVFTPSSLFVDFPVVCGFEGKSDVYEEPAKRMRTDAAPLPQMMFPGMVPGFPTVMPGMSPVMPGMVPPVGEYGVWSEHILGISIAVALHETKVKNQSLLRL